MDNGGFCWRFQGKAAQVDSAGANIVNLTIIIGAVINKYLFANTKDKQTKQITKHITN